jgi:hypothetical protein
MAQQDALMAGTQAAAVDFQGLKKHAELTGHVHEGEQ